VTPKFRTHDAIVRDSKRIDKARTLARKVIRENKYEGTEAVVRINVNA
jgi:citrate lyase beta subunit